MNQKLEMVYYPDPRLRKVSQPITNVTPELREIADEMFQVMYRTRGIGLAGPQVAYSWRVVVANMTGEKKDEQVFINPVILKREGTQDGEEGCLSLPGIVGQIRRAAKVTVEVMDLDGRKETIHAEGLYARLFQHECDHLDGILISDKLTPADQKQYQVALKKLEQDFKENPQRSYPIEASAGL